MSRPLHIEVQGGSRECFTNPKCPVYAMFLLHLQRAPYSNVFWQRLSQLQRKHPDLVTKKEKHNNATIVCDQKNCPVYSQPRFSNPVIKVLHLKPDTYDFSNRRSYGI